MNYSPKAKSSNVHYFALPIGTVHGSLPPPELGPDSARILQSADARCGALYRCSEAAIPPYFMQILDLETQYVYKKNILSIQCKKTRPFISISNFQPRAAQLGSNTNILS